MIALAALLMAAEAVSFPLVLPKPAQVEMRVEQTREDSDGGQGSVTTVYAKTIEPKADGFRVTLKPLDTDLPDGDSATEQAPLENFAKMTFIYVADQNLRPTALEDWPGVLAAMGKTLAPLTAGQPDKAEDLKAELSTFSRMSPQQAVGVVLREDDMLTWPINAALEIGQPRPYQGQLPSPMGGPPIKASGTTTLEEIDQARGVAVVRLSTILDTKSASESTSRAINDILAARGETAPAGKIKVEGFHKCLYEIDLNNGLPVRADCGAWTATRDPISGQTTTRTDRWVITQTLKN